MAISISTAARAESLRRLPNGLHYVVVEDHASPVVSLQVWVRCGGVNENDVTAGVSHFLEHMIFKGTGRLSAGEISRVVETRGGSINAATSAETTHYYIDMPSEGFDVGLEVLAESVLHPAFPPEEFEKERKVILEEIRRRNDNPESDLWDGFLQVIYKRAAYKQQVIGSVKTITAMTREMMTAQHAAYYVPNNMVVVVAGDVKTSRARKKIESLFGNVPSKPLPPPPLLLEPRPESSEIKNISRSAKQAHVAAGFIGPTLGDPGQVAMDVLSTMLGGGQSSRLVQVLREKKRLVWNVGSSFITHGGTGLFGVFADCPTEKARSLPNEIYFVLEDAQDNGFSPAELARAKSQLKSSWLFSRETYHGQASQWGYFAALGHPEIYTDYIEKLNLVTLEDVQGLLGKYFQGRELSGAVLTPPPAEDVEN